MSRLQLIPHLQHNREFCWKEHFIAKYMYKHTCKQVFLTSSHCPCLVYPGSAKVHQIWTTMLLGAECFALQISLGYNGHMQDWQLPR